MIHEEIEKILEGNGLTIIEGGPATPKSVIKCGRCSCEFYSRPYDLVSRSKGTCTVCRKIKDEVIESEYVEVRYNKETRKRTMFVDAFATYVEGSADKINKAFSRMYFQKEGEVFKYIRGTDNTFAVSDQGVVVNLQYGYPKQVGSGNENREYKSVYIKYGGKLAQRTIHQVVAETFIGKPEAVGPLFVNHKDMDKGNNKVDNLEWCTASENVQHAWDNGELRGASKKVALEREGEYVEFESMRKAAAYLKRQVYTDASLEGVCSYMSAVAGDHRKERTIYGFTVTKL